MRNFDNRQYLMSKFLYQAICNDEGNTTLKQIYIPVWFRCRFPWYRPNINQANGQGNHTQRILYSTSTAIDHEERTRCT